MKNIKNTTEVKTQKRKNHKKKNYNVLGLLELFVALSVSYLIVMVVLGTDTLEPKIMAVPATLWVGYILIKKFTK